MAADKIDRIKKIAKKLKPQTLPKEPDKDYFAELMRQRQVKTEPTNTEAKDFTQKTTNTLFDEVRALNQKVEHVTRTSPSELVAQSEDVIAQIGELKDKLETPDLEIKSSVQTILRNKLSHIDDNLKIALDKAGIEYMPPEKPTSLNTPMQRFLGLLTHSENQLRTLASDVKIMAQSNKEFSPANMLLIQIKVSYIQQEIELFTSILSKALESTKSIMAVQV